MWSTRRVTIKQKSPEKKKNKKRRSEQWKFIVIHNPWSLCSYSFQVQVCWKQNWRTEWQNNTLPLNWDGFSSSGSTSDRYLVITLEKTQHTLIDLAWFTHSLGPDSLCCGLGLRRKAVIPPASLKAATHVPQNAANAFSHSFFVIGGRLGKLVWLLVARDHLAKIGICIKTI